MWRGNDVPIRQIREDFAKYLYLPKLSSPQLLQQAIEAGISLVAWQKESFALADFYDQEAKRYKGLRAGISLMIQLDGNSLLVKPDIAKEQLEKDKAEAEAKKPDEPTVPTPGYPGEPSTAPANDSGQPAPVVQVKTRFYGNVETDAIRFFRSTDDIDKEILKHLCSKPGCNVRISIHIEADNTSGFDASTERTIRENGRTLGFGSIEFE